MGIGNAGLKNGPDFRGVAEEFAALGEFGLR
jgi:hypothetical protein